MGNRLKPSTANQHLKKRKMKQEALVIIIGAGPAGLATAACLSNLSIPSLILEREDCLTPLWRNRTYDRLHLHLSKDFCQLPLLPYPTAYPTFISKDQFLLHMDDYARMFSLQPLFNQEVRSLSYNSVSTKWSILTKEDSYDAEYVVIATGENDVPYVPHIDGINEFTGKVLHSSEYKSGKEYEGKNVLVVGSGNSGMEIAYDLCSFGARTSIVIRSPMHIVSRYIWLFCMRLMKYFSLETIDKIALLLCYLKYGDTSKFCIRRPAQGPFYLKANTPVYPIIDCGTFQKIKTGEIQVLPSLERVKGYNATFSDGKAQQFDAIILATGYRSKINSWLKDDDYLIDDMGMARQAFPNHWKGKNGLYCAGFTRRGFYGISEDAISIANDISKKLKLTKSVKKMI